jgi:hypothetical protein
LLGVFLGKVGVSLAVRGREAVAVVALFNGDWGTGDNFPSSDPIIGIREAPTVFEFRR